MVLIGDIKNGGAELRKIGRMTPSEPGVDSATVRESITSILYIKK